MHPDENGLVKELKRLFCMGYAFMSAADADMDKAEFLAFANALQNCDSIFLSPFVKRALHDFYENDCGSNVLILSGLVNLHLKNKTKIIDIMQTAGESIVRFKVGVDHDPFLSNDDISLIVTDLLQLMSIVAKASGGLFGLNKVSKEERTAFLIVLSVFGFDDKTANEIAKHFL